MSCLSLASVMRALAAGILILTTQANAQGSAWNLPGFDLPIAIQETGAGVLTFAGTSYIVVSSNYIASSTDKTLLWNKSTKQWTTGTSCPFPGNHQAAVVIANKIYLFGGMKTFSAAPNALDPSQKVQIGSLFRDSTGKVNIKWTRGTDIPFGGGSGSAGLFNGKILYCGGNLNGVTTNRCAMYTPSAAGGTWVARSNMLGGGRHHAAACVWNNHFYVFGGRSGTNNGDVFGETHIYNFQRNSWRISNPRDPTSPAPMPVARGGTGKAICRGGKAYIFGGELPNFKVGTTPANPQIGLTSQGVFVRQDIYNLVTNKWSRGSNMPVGLHGMFPVVLDGLAYFAGGATKVAYQPSTTFMTFRVPLA